MSAASGYEQDYEIEKRVNSMSGTRYKPMVADPVKLHLATWLVSVTTSIVAMWAASFVLINAQAEQAKSRIQLDLTKRIEVLESEMKGVHITNSQMMQDSRNAREREIKRDEDTAGGGRASSGG